MVVHVVVSERWEMLTRDLAYEFLETDTSDMGLGSGHSICIYLRRHHG